MKSSKIVKLFFVVSLSFYASCSKQFTYCYVLDEIYVLNKGAVRKVYYKFDYQFKTINQDKVNELILQGYVLDTNFKSYPYECLNCNEEAQNVVKKLGGYCVSN